MESIIINGIVYKNPTIIDSSQIEPKMLHLVLAEIRNKALDIMESKRFYLEGFALQKQSEKQRRLNLEKALQQNLLEREQERERRRKHKQNLFAGKNPHLYDKSEIEALKAQLIAQYGEVCMVCNKTKKILVDHIKARSKGGTNDYSNLQLLCWGCNGKKGLKEIDYRPC